MRTRIVPLLLLLGTLSPGAAAADAPFPYALGVELRWGDRQGPSAVFDDLEGELLLELRSRACFESVARVDADAVAPDDADPPGLLLRVALSGFREEVQYDASIAERATSYEPGIERKLRAEFRVTAGLELVDTASGLVVRSSSVFVLQRARPVLPGQDDLFAREEARRLGVDELALETARRACRGSAKKLQRRIDKAREAALSGEPAR